MKRLVRPPGEAGRLLVELVEREVELLRLLSRSDRVPALHGWALTDAHVFIATELCPESLAQHIARQPNLHIAQRLRLVREAAQALAWLHDPAKDGGGWSHNDLKPENLLARLPIARLHPISDLLERSWRPGCSRQHRPLAQAQPASWRR